MELKPVIGAPEGPLGAEVDDPLLEMVLVRPMPTGAAVIDDVLATGVADEIYEELDVVFEINNRKTLRELMDQNTLAKAPGLLATYSTHVAARVELEWSASVSPHIGRHSVAAFKAYHDPEAHTFPA